MPTSTIARMTTWVMIGCLAIGFARAAETGGSIAGVVRDNTGKPAVGASVKVKNTDRGVTVLVISQQGGRFKASTLLPGKYTVQALGGGLQSEDAAVTVNGGSVTQNLALAAPQDFKKVVSISQSAPLLPEGEGKVIIVSLCTDCHSNGLQEILFSRKSAEGWAETVAKMQNHPYGNARSLDIAPEQKTTVLEYLAKNLGPDEPPLDVSDKAPKAWMRGAALKSIVTEFDLPKGANAHDVAVDSKGIGWVAEGGKGVIGRLDPETMDYKRIPIPGDKNGATAIAVDSRDRVWFGDGTNNRLVQYDPQTGEFTSYPLPAEKGERKNVNTIRVHPDGTVWATGISSNEIFHLDPATKKVTASTVPAALVMKTNLNPYGMAIAPDGVVWFAERRSDKVGRIDPKTGEITEMDVPTKGAVLRRMAADVNGNLWFGEYGKEGKLAMIDYKTGKITEYPTPTKYSGAYSVDVDRKRNLIWVNEMMADQIARFDPRTKTFAEFPIGSPKSSVRRIEADPSKPYRVWYAGLDTDKVGFLDVKE